MSVVRRRKLESWMRTRTKYDVLSESVASFAPSAIFKMKSSQKIARLWLFVVNIFNSILSLNTDILERGGNHFNISG